MATNTSITLKAGKIYTDSISGMTITGTAGNETVSILAKVNGSAIVDVGNIKLSGKIADYTLSDAGSQVIIKSGDTTIATVIPATQGTILLFSDGSKATLSVSQDAASFHYTTIQMLPKSTLTLTDGDVSIKGAPGGSETVRLDPSLHNVTVDYNVENVVINADLGSIAIAGGKAEIALSGLDGAKIADLMLGRGHSEILTFNNGSGALSLDSSGKGLFNLISIKLQAGDSFTPVNSGISISATAPSDNTLVTLNAGCNNEHISAAIGQVKFSGKYTDYLYLNKSGVLYVYDKTGKTEIADIQVQQDANGTSLAFSDGNNFAASLHSGAISIGASTVSITKPAIITLPAPGAPAVTAGSSSFHYSLALGSFGQYQSTIQADVTAALNNIGKYLNAQGIFNVQVLPEYVNPGIIAEASGNLVSTPNSLLATEHGANTVTTFQMTSLTGADPNPGGYDAVVKINMSNLSRLNLDANAAPSSSQLDLVTALTHEMFHAIGFEGFTGYSSSRKTAFDTFINMQGGKPYFTGPNAEAVYGGPVPLAPASAGLGSAYFHVDVAGDLMATSLSYGQVRTVSALDLAILKDIGIPEVALIGTQALHA